MVKIVNLQHGTISLPVSVQTFNVAGRGMAHIITNASLQKLLSEGFSNRWTDWAIDSIAVKTVELGKHAAAFFIDTDETHVPDDYKELLTPEKINGTVGVDFIGVTMSFICIDENNRIVMQLRTDQCRDEHWTWDTGSGQLEFGEDLEEAVLREVSEEYGGAKGEIVEKLLPVNLLRVHDGVPTHWVSLPFIIRVKSSEIKIGEPHKMADLKFIESKEDIPKPLHRCVTKLFETHWGTIKKYLS